MSTYALWLIFISLTVVGSLMYNIAVKIGGDNHINVFLFTLLLAFAAVVGHGTILGLYKFVFQPDAKLNIDATGIWMVVLAGLAVVMIDVAYFMAVKYGGMAASQVVWTVGGIILVTPVAVLVFKEHLNWQNMLGVALGIVALYLVSKKVMGLIVKNSGINGRGLYTDVPIEKAAIVLTWNPKLLSAAELDALPKDEHRYLETIDGKTYLMQAPERYVNHSCDANTNIGDACDIAVRDIKAGEEITSDYRMSNSDQDFDCRCGSKNCAGRILTRKHA